MFSKSSQHPFEWLILKQTHQHVTEGIFCGKEEGQEKEEGYPTRWSHPNIERFEEEYVWYKMKTIDNQTVLTPMFKESTRVKLLAYRKEKECSTY